MKTKVLFFVIASFLCYNFAFSQNNSVNPDPKMQVRQAIVSKVIYPEFAVNEGIEGTVYASFSISKDGKIQVIQVESCNEELKIYVSSKLKEIEIEGNEQVADEVYNMKFKFELL